LPHHGANVLHIAPAGKAPPSSQPALHTLVGEPRPTLQCCPDGQSASLLQATLTQPSSPDEQMQLASMHSQPEPSSQKHVN
jgi:hypothetical protein